MAKKRKQNKGAASRKMARIVVAEKRNGGQYGFRQKMVPLDNVKEELKAARKN
ncbi:hypothetical protein [Salisaeta longa]|uniref:hypothetical protein n=1 Tax=Salisaeta longa TaxID=503170 RepID=UPI0003B34A98|nr:hypothetical protein [Salisaeta longa]